MKLVQLQYFLKVVECHSISRAAREMYVSQPALSESIKAFEDEMSFKLFDRTRKGVELTAKGEEVYQLVLNIERNVEKLTKFANNNVDTPKISLAVVPMISGTIFLEIINRIYQKFSKIEILPEELRPRRLLERLRSGNVDFALCSRRKEDEAVFQKVIAETGLQHKKIADVPLTAYVAQTNPLAKYQRVNPQDLADLTCFVLNDYQDKNLAGHEYILSSRDIIFNAVAHDRGYTIMPRTASVGNNYFVHGQICAIPLQAKHTVPLELVFPSKNDVTKLDQEIGAVIVKTLLANIDF